MRLFLPLVAVAALTGASADASDGQAKEAHLVPMTELAVPIVDGGRAAGTLRVRLVLDMADAAAAESAGSALPPLRAASLGAAMEHARLYASPMAPVNVERLAADMTAALRAADARVGRVLIVEVGASRA